MAKLDFYKIEKTEKEAIFNAIANDLGMTPFAVEKDWWVSRTLDIIFKMDIAGHLVFKGGTSLSKAWKLINRFSEDIDLALDKKFFEGISTECVQKPLIHLIYKINNMKKIFLAILLVTGLFSVRAISQAIKEKEVPVNVKTAFEKKYPEAKNVKWEKEKGNYEANWGGKSGEDNSAAFSPAGDFLEIVVVIPINQLPANIPPFVGSHYNKAKIKEAGKVTDASGKQMFEVEIKGKDLIFDQNGNFMKED